MRYRAIVLASLLSSCGSPLDTSSTLKSEPKVLYPSPWPKFRGNLQQNGRSEIRPYVGSAKLWSYQTAKGIFSSPIIGPNGNIYIGSADKNFYAFSQEGKVLWSTPTGEIIDSAALIAKNGKLFFGSGDGILRCLDAETGEGCWSFSAEPPSATGGLINWFEGNVAIGVDGTLYAPNDNFSLYAVAPETGKQVWKFPLNDQSWSSPAVDPKTGDLFFGSNYIAPLKILQPFYKNIFSLDAKGKIRWRQSVQASVAASPLLSREDLVVVGGFDGVLYAYDKNTGKERWSFKTQDHIYASPAESADGTIIQASTDGNVYAIDGRDGRLKWSFASGEPIRSSPAIDGEGRIYFGSGDGSLYVLNPEGSLRYRLQLIQEDRNDLNASPALGEESVLIAGENGELWSVPYDYCLRADGRSDERCQTSQEPRMEGVELSFVSPFGSRLVEAPQEISASESLTFSISKLANGRPEAVRFDETRVAIQSFPQTDTDLRITGDGKSLIVTPKGTWNGSEISLQLSLGYLEGEKPSTITQAINVKIRAKPQFSGEEKTFVLRRLAVPVPAIMPSYNQIGFDSLSYVIRVLETENGKGSAWVMGAIEHADGTVSVDPKTEASFPLTWDDSSIGTFMSSQDGFTATSMNLKLPFSYFRLSLLSWREGSGIVSALASTECKDIPSYGYFLRELGFCSPKGDRLTLGGAAELKVIPTSEPAVGSEVSWKPSKNWLGYAGLEAEVKGPNDELLSFVLVDAATRMPITVDGKKLSKVVTGTGTKLTITYASGPAEIRSYVLKGATILSSALWSKQSNGVYKLKN